MRMEYGPPGDQAGAAESAPAFRLSRYRGNGFGAAPSFR